MRARGVALAGEFRGKGVKCVPFSGRGSTLYELTGVLRLRSCLLGAFANSVLLGPAMDVMRNPKAGRSWER
jgi:hypothetical protein